MQKELENLIIRMLSGKRTNDQYATFYGYFLLRINKVLNPKIPAPAGICITNGKPTILINWQQFSALTQTQQSGVMIHEIEHLIREHIGHRKPNDKKEHRIYNIAQDWAINQYIPELSGIGIQHDQMIQMEEFKDAKLEQPFEYYLDLLRKAKKEWDKEGNEKEKELSDKLIDDHSISEESSDSEKQETKEWLKNALRDTIKEMKKTGRAGNIPDHIQQLYNELLDSTVPWKQQLRKFFARMSSLNRTSTRKRRNRRYGLYQPGKKKNTHLKLALCVDESGSISDETFQQFFGEIDKVADYADIYVLQCDTQVNKIYEYQKGKTYERTGQGGTLYQPMFEAASKLDIDGIIVFGDGDCFEDNLQKPKLPVLWAIEKGRSAPVEWGYKCEVDTKENI